MAQDASVVANFIPQLDVANVATNHKRQRMVCMKDDDLALVETLEERKVSLKRTKPDIFFQLCAICLDQTIHPTILNNSRCTHVFCLKCIYEYVQATLPERATCPLCRNPFVYGLYDIKSMSYFRRYYFFDQQRQLMQQYKERMLGLPEFDMMRSNQPEKFTIPQRTIIDLRRLIYARSLKPDKLNCSFSKSVEYWRSFTGETEIRDRIKPFIEREQKVMHFVSECDASENEPSRLQLEIIISLLKSVDLVDHEAFFLLQQCLFEHTSTFIKQLYHFSQCNLPLATYDRSVRFRGEKLDQICDEYVGYCDHEVAEIIDIARCDISSPNRLRHIDIVLPAVMRRSPEHNRTQVIDLIDE